MSRSELIKKGFLNVGADDLRKENPAAEKKHKEGFSERELRELMGVNRDTYKRGPGGAFRRR